MEIPETAQAEALREVARLGKERADALAKAKELLPLLRDAAVKAARVEAPRTRIRELAHVSPDTLYGWLDKAGVEIREKRPARRKGDEETA
ncbi:hypothetical protein [Streptomyces sp. S1]|uniref:hypothetical protein n=1 Tax=Streptomyces sp. S1 TaxID=718288 RepID=UPI000EF7C683|nr:hypothetical protein [Streptomyces sp. S1]